MRQNPITALDGGDEPVPFNARAVKRAKHRTELMAIGYRAVAVGERKGEQGHRRGGY